MLLIGFVHLWELWLTYNIARSEKDKFDLHVYFSLTSIMRNLKTCPPFSCHKFIFCPHAIIPPCNLICQIYQRKKKNKERGRQKKKIIVFCLFPLYDVKSRYLWHSPSHIVFFLWLLSLLPTVYHLKRSQLSFSIWRSWYSASIFLK